MTADQSTDPAVATPSRGLLRGLLGGPDVPIPEQRGESPAARTTMIPGLPTAARNNLDRTFAWGLLWGAMLGLGMTATATLVIVLAPSPWNIIAWVLGPLFAVKTLVLARLASRALGIAVLGHGRRRFRG